MTTKQQFTTKCALILCLMFFMTGGAWCQDKKPATPRKIFVRETLGLLKVGFGEKDIFKYWDKKGWPAAINDIDFVQIRDAKASPKLLSRLRKLLEGHAVFSELADHFEPFEVKLADGKMLKMLKPRGWYVSHSKTQDRYTFHEHAGKVPGWFRRTSLFVWVFDSDTWKKRNEKSLTRIVLAAAKKRMTQSGLLVGAPKDSRLIVKKGNREFPVSEAVCRDRRDDLRGVVSMSAFVDEKSKKVIVVGYTSRLTDEATTAKKKSKMKTPRDQMAQMLSTLRIGDK